MNDRLNFPVAAARHVVRKAKGPHHNILTIDGLRQRVAGIWSELAQDSRYTRDMREAGQGQTLVGEVAEARFWQILSDNGIDVSGDRDLHSVDSDLSQILTGRLAPEDELAPGYS